MLPYYRIEKTIADKMFFFNNNGYFNFWDEYLIMRIIESNEKDIAGIVLINRTGSKFSGSINDFSENNKEHYKNTFNKSKEILKPEEMFLDFPELVNINFI